MKLIVYTLAYAFGFLIGALLCYLIGAYFVGDADMANWSMNWKAWCGMWAFFWGLWIGFSLKVTLNFTIFDESSEPTQNIAYN